MAEYKGGQLVHQVKSGKLKGTYSSTGDFRTPENGEFYYINKRILRANPGTKSHPMVIMRKVHVKRELNEEHLMNWLLGHRMLPLTIECFACNCNGFVTPVHVRTSPHGFEHIGFYHTDKGAPLAILENGIIAFMDGVKGNVYIYNDEYEDIPYQLKGGSECIE